MNKSIEDQLNEPRGEVNSDSDELYQWLDNLKVGDDVCVLDNGQGYSYTAATIIDLDSRSIRTDSPIYRMFTRANGMYVDQPDDEYSPNAWLEIPNDKQSDEAYQIPDPANVNPLFLNMRFVFARPIPKNIWEKFGRIDRFVWSVGGLTSLFVSTTTSFVVADDPSDKRVIKARELGITVISWDEFKQMAGEG